MNCKPGDLAFLRGLTRHPQFNGRVVKVIRWDIADGIWQVDPQWEMDARLKSFVVIRAYDKNLVPISGIPVNDEVTDDIKEPA